MNVLIVDDEYIIRDGLARSLDWPSLGFDAIETAEHGLEALEMIEMHKPDLILTDVRMPFMDGLELIRQVQKKYFGIFFIIISGHEEFSYAKTALQLDAFDYILKPINLVELEQVIKRAKAHIDSQNIYNKEISDIKEQLQKNIPALREHFILEIIFKKLSADQIEKCAESYGFNPSRYYSTAIIEVDEFYYDSSTNLSGNQKLVEIYFENILNVTEKTFISTISTHEYLLLVSEDTEIKCEEKIKCTATEILEKANSYNLSVTISIGSTVSHLNNLGHSYENTLLTSNKKFMYGCNRVIYFSETPEEFQGSKDEPFDITAFKQALTFFDKDSILLEFKKIRATALGQKHLSKIFLQLLCYSIFFECKRALMEQGVEIEVIIENPVDTIQKLIKQPSYEMMFDNLEYLIKAILDCRDEIRFKQYSADIDKAKKFLRNNFSDVSLSLKTLSKHINMSACYFSVIFKRETGITYINYLTNIRIEKAKELLLNSNSKVYEIAYEVGYDNPTYFSTLFKKLTGISPFDYKRQVLTPTKD